MLHCSPTFVTHLPKAPELKLAQKEAKSLRALLGRSLTDMTVSDARALKRLAAAQATEQALVADKEMLKRDQNATRAELDAANAAATEAKKQAAGEEVIRNFEKAVMLQVLDSAWKEHLAAMDYLRQGIHLRGYAQKNPKQEYKREAFEMFGAMMEQVKHDTISILTRIRIQGEDDLAEMQRQREEAQKLQFQHAQASALGAQPQAPGAVQPPGGQPSPRARRRTR